MPLCFRRAKVLAIDILLLVPVAVRAADNLIRPGDADLQLLEPLDGGANTIAPSPGIDVIFTYFNRSWPWLLGVAAGIAVLQAIIGGIEVMSNQKDRGKIRLQWAIGGLLIVVFAGMILRTLNPIFYQ
jgi:heme A synthase